MSCFIRFTKYLVIWKAYNDIISYDLNNGSCFQNKYVIYCVSMTVVFGILILLLLLYIILILHIKGSNSQTNALSVDNFRIVEESEIFF